ncbi:hypothetical protein ACFL6S_08645 [Candidatus Poribacteria bacterium]
MQQPCEEDLYPIIYEDEDYEIWIDLDERIVDIFFRERGLTLHLTDEEYQAFRQTVINFTWVDVDEQVIDIYLETSGLKLVFSHKDLQSLKDVLNRLELLPKWWIHWH